jgi:cell division protein FtsW
MTDKQDNISLDSKTSVASDIEATKPKPRTDGQIWGIYFSLVLFSLIELYSASSREVSADNILGPVLRHGGLLFGGFLIMLTLQNTNYHKYYKYTYVFVIVAILATIYTMFFGQVINGARRSFSLFGAISVQPSELLKMAAALFIARVLSSSLVEGKTDVSKKAVIWVAVMVMIFGGLLIKQGLTNTILLMAISISMMIICGVSWRKLGIILGIYALLAGGYGVVKHFTKDANDSEDRTSLRVGRLMSFLEKDKYDIPITSENQQEQYSYIAQANGGLFGVMPGNSRETARLPLAFSDYIYAIVIEDLGLVGGMVLMLLYLWLLARAGKIASQCKKAYPALLVIGMAVFIVYQALFHMAIVTGCAPVSGQPLPFISKGGSSVIISSLALGIMLSVSRFAARKGDKNEASQNLTSLSDSEDSANNLTQL